MELGRLFVAHFIFIKIIVDIIVNLSPCLLFYESKVLDTLLREDVPRRRTNRGEDSSPGKGDGSSQCWTPVFGSTVMVLLSGRLLASVHFFL